MEWKYSEQCVVKASHAQNTGRIKMWEIRIKQYFQIQDVWWAPQGRSLENGNSWVPIPVIARETGPSTASKMTVPSTAEKERCLDFGGNEATKKTQKAMLKQHTGTTKVNTASTEISTASFSDATVYAFLSHSTTRVSTSIMKIMSNFTMMILEEIDLNSSKAVKYWKYASEKAMCAIEWCLNLIGVTCKGENQANIALRQSQILSLKPTTGCDKESDNSKENTDDYLKQQQKTDSKTSYVKSPLKVDKDWKEKFFCPANHVREEEPKKARENNDAPIIEDWVSDDEDEVEPIPKVDPFSTASKMFNTVKERGNGAIKPFTVGFGRPIKPNGASLSNSQLNDKGFVDSGCSRHMTGNIAHLSDFKDFDGGYVTFGGGAYGGRINTASYN
ncbi:hypothetical protein Tco_0366698 [Tanacetum coccineum]